ncbi:EAL domain-containing protein [uncultured Draconibacterium sp.]|uniref:EAL domain-containing protein n=1 Tax=uncultured Draconibacterium sp. TaxID=1573823 RepID=UPI00374A35F5
MPSCGLLIVIQISGYRRLADSSTILEISENDIKSLLSRGVKLALDDFGTGHSSMNVLRNFPFETAKLDKVFVSVLFGELTGR